MTAEVSLYAAPTRAVVVPRSIITLAEDGQLGLRIVGADNLAQFAAVQIIDDTPEGLVVTGVPEGVRIITAGQDLVQQRREGRCRGWGRPMRIVETAIANARLTISVLVFLMLAGTLAYVISIPKEAEPDIQIPILYVSMTTRASRPRTANACF
jgi:hypothetical protein